MEGWIFIVWIVIALVRILSREREAVTTEERPETLCRTCANAHMVTGLRGKELISCTFGGTLRAMKFEVRECTGFSKRLVNITPVRVAGFLPQENEVYAEIRIAKAGRY
jgi:hypothetical protein